MVLIQTEKAAMMTHCALLNVNNIIVKVYNERFVMKSIPLAGADMPRCGDI